MFDPEGAPIFPLFCISSRTEPLVLKPKFKPVPLPAFEAAINGEFPLGPEPRTIPPKVLLELRPNPAYN